MMEGEDVSLLANDAGYLTDGDLDTLVAYSDTNHKHLAEDVEYDTTATHIPDKDVQGALDYAMSHLYWEKGGGGDYINPTTLNDNTTGVGHVFRIYDENNGVDFFPGLIDEVNVAYISSFHMKVLFGVRIWAQDYETGILAFNDGKKGMPAIVGMNGDPSGMLGITPGDSAMGVAGVNVGPRSSGVVGLNDYISTSLDSASTGVFGYNSVNTVYGCGVAAKNAARRGYALFVVDYAKTDSSYAGLFNGRVGIDGDANVADEMTIGAKLNIATGTNATCGTGTLGTGGTVSINTNQVTANSLIFITPTANPGGQFYISSRTVGTSFTVASTDPDDDGVTFSWLLIN